MNSWLPGGAQAWNAQLRDTISRASVSVQQLAEKAELQQFGDKVLATAANFAEHGEAALSDARKSVVGGAAVFGLLQKDEQYASVEELARRFAQEGRELGHHASAGDITEFLRRWTQRLEADGDAGLAAKRALCSSGALPEALARLARSKVGRSTIRNATAANVTAAGAEQAPQLLRQLLTSASPASPAVLDQLLLLLAEATKAVAQGCKAGGGAETEAIEEDLRSILGLLASACTLGPEVEVREAARRAEAVEAAVQALTGSSTAPAEGLPVVGAIASGSTVWAEWPGNGQWYRARAVSTHGSDAKVDWLTPPSDVECGREAEYLVGALGDDTQSSMLPMASMVTIAQERPHLNLKCGLDAWRQQLSTAEGHNRLFVDLRATCEESLAPDAASSAAEGGARARPDEAALQQAFTEIAGNVVSLRLGLAQRREALGHADLGGVAAAALEPKSLQTSDEPVQSGPGDGSPQKALQARVAELKERRADLLAQLRAVEEELSQASAELARAGGGSSESGAAAGGGTERFRRLTESLAVASQVEGLLATRRQQASLVDRSKGNLKERSELLAKACLSSEVSRRRQLEELVQGLHAALWGPRGEDWAQEASKANEVRTLIGRTGNLVEQAWKEMVQLAAETLGDGGLVGARSEDLSRAAKRYKELRKELGANLERLNKLEANAEQEAQLKSFLKSSKPPAGTAGPAGGAGSSA